MALGKRAFKQALRTARGTLRGGSAVPDAAPPAGWSQPPGTTHYKPSPRFQGGVDNLLAGAPAEGLQLSWTPAPEASHLFAFRYYDPRDPRITTHGGMGQLEVIFKQPRGGRSRPYAYFFPHPAAGEAIRAKLAASAHPYGEVLKPLVIDAGVQYTQL